MPTTVLQLALYKTIQNVWFVCKKKVLIFFRYVIVAHCFGFQHFFSGWRKKAIKFCDDIQFLTFLSDWHSRITQLLIFYTVFYWNEVDVINIELEIVDDNKKK